MNKKINIKQKIIMQTLALNCWHTYLYCDSIFLEKDSIKLNTLANKLSELTLGEKDVKIFIKADKNLTYDRVISVVSAIYNAGFFDVTLVTDLRKM